MKNITYRTYVAFLKSIGLSLRRTNASHEMWDFDGPEKLDRPVVIRPKDKEIPLTFLQTNRTTLVLSGVFNSRKAHDAALDQF